MLSEWLLNCSSNNPRARWDFHVFHTLSMSLKTHFYLHLKLHSHSLSTFIVISPTMKFLHSYFYYNQFLLIMIGDLNIYNPSTTILKVLIIALLNNRKFSSLIEHLFPRNSSNCTYIRFVTYISCYFHQLANSIFLLFFFFLHCFRSVTYSYICQFSS